MVILAFNHFIESVSAPACQQGHGALWKKKKKKNCAHIFLQECVHIIVSSSVLQGLSGWYEGGKSSQMSAANYLKILKGSRHVKGFMVSDI